jgi:hypothetical protein
LMYNHMVVRYQRRGASASPTVQNSYVACEGSHRSDLGLVHVSILRLPPPDSHRDHEQRAETLVESRK